MSKPIFERYVDERGNISVRVSQDVQVLTCEEANRIEAEYKRMQAENAKLRELVRDLYEMAYPECPSAFEAAFANRMRELRVEVDA